MIDLTRISQTKSSLNAFAAPAAMTSQQARIEAQNLLQTGLSRSALNTMDLLMVAGVLPSHRLPSSERTLRYYQHQRLLDRLPFTTPEMQAVFKSYGLPYPEESRLALYTFGPVGIEIIRMRYEIQITSAYLAYPLERVMHDVIMNEVILSIADQAIVHGWTPVWVSKRESTIYDVSHKTVLLAPGGMLRLQRDGDDERVYLLEHEDNAAQARRNIARYRTVFERRDLWSNQWGVVAFPPLLSVFQHKSIGHVYAEQVGDGLKAQIYGRTLESALSDDFATWYHFNKSQRTPVFPWRVE